MTLAYTPTVEDVATHLRARTRGPSGAELGTFTDDTTPTDEQVRQMIDLAMPFVSGALGTVPEGCAAGARSLASLKAAEMVEISYYPEQLQPGGTVSALRALYADLLIVVQSCVSGGGEGGGGGDGDSTPPASCFYDLYPFGSWRGEVPPYGRYIDGLTPTVPVVRVIDTSDL